MTAYLLQQRANFPLEITLLEAGSRLGGKVVTRNFKTGSVPFEAGAAELYDYSQVGPDPLRELVRELGLITRPMEGRTVVFGDTLLRNDEEISQHLGARTASALKDFTRKARKLISPADYYESDWREDNKDPLARQKFSDLLETVPDEAARKYIRVAIHSDLATEPHQTNAVYGLQNCLMNEPGYMRLYTIDGGIERLVRGLADRIDARVLLNHRVKSVRRAMGNTFEVLARHRGTDVVETFDYVVAALPNNWLPAIDWEGPTLARAMHAHHVHYDYPAHYLRVSLLFQSAFWREQIAESYFMLDSFGGCCVYDETSRGHAGEHGVLGFLIGGEAALSLCNFDDASLFDRMLDALPASLRHGRELFVEGHVQRWVGEVNGLPGGFPAREPDSRHVPEPKEHPDLFVVGDYLFDSTLNGVLDSADVVAEWILEDVADEIAAKGVLAAT